MGYLSGFQEYIDEHYLISIYDHALQSGEEFTFHAHDHTIFQGKISVNGTYDVEIEHGDGDKVRKYHPKTDIKLIYPSLFQQKVQPQIKIEPKISRKNLPPIVSGKERNYVKNKSLYPLMEERTVLFFYLLEGEVIKGLIADFSRYEITVHLKGVVPITIFRHALLDITDKKKRSYLKSFQEKAKDWQKSQLYISQST